MTPVAFLGLGAMGRPMAARLLGAGHDLRVWNRTPGRDEALVSAGAIRSTSPAEAARDAEAVITMLADPAALEEVLLGDHGVASAARPEAVVIDMSTVGPTPIREAARRLAPVVVVDAPVLGSIGAAESGALQILAGGEADVVARHTGLLGALGNVVHVGPLGAGAALKLAANAAAISALAALGEVLAFADRSGLDGAVALDALERGPLGSLVSRWRDKIEGRTDRVEFRLALARKDLALAEAEAGDVGLELLVPRAAAGRADAAIAAGRGDEDLGALVAAIRAS